MDTKNFLNEEPKPKKPFNLVIFIPCILIVFFIGRSLGYSQASRDLEQSFNMQKDILSFVANSRTDDDQDAHYDLGYDDGYSDGFSDAESQGYKQFASDKDYTDAYSDGYAAAEDDYISLSEEQYALGCIDTLLECGYVSDAAEYANTMYMWDDFLGELHFYGYLDEYNYYSKLNGLD